MFSKGKIDGFCEYIKFIEDGKTKGHIQYVSRYDESATYVISLKVYPEYERRGIGTSLVLEVAKISKTRRMRFIRLDSVSNIPDSKNLYIKLGFKFKDKTSGPEMSCLTKDLISHRTII